MRFVPTWCALALCAGAWLSSGAVAHAQKASARSVSALADEARTREPQARALQAIDALAAHGDASATAALAALVHEGQPDAITDRVLEALAAHPRAGALALLVELTAHRRPGARVRAYRALHALGPSEAIAQQLARGLDDSDAAVRASCAAALGERGAGAAAQLPSLLQALVRGVHEAGRAVGSVAPEPALPSVHEKLSGIAMQTRLDTYEALLARADISERAKLDLLARIGEIASPSAKAFLGRLVLEHKLGARGSALERAAIDTEKRIAVPAPSPTPSRAP